MSSNCHLIHAYQADSFPGNVGVRDERVKLDALPLVEAGTGKRKAEPGCFPPCRRNSTEKNEKETQREARITDGE